MKLVLEFEIDEDRDYEPAAIEDEMAGAMASTEEFEGAGVTCKIVGERSKLASLPIGESRLNEAPTDNLRVNPYDLEPE